MSDIHHSYTATEAPKQLGIDSNLLRKINADIRTSTSSTLPSMESIFAEAQEGVENILKTAIYPRFVKFQMTNSASKALSTDRARYQGLGDCFCLTDPGYSIPRVRISETSLIGFPARPTILLFMRQMGLSA